MVPRYLLHSSALKRHIYNRAKGVYCIDQTDGSPTSIVQGKKLIVFRMTVFFSA